MSADAPPGLPRIVIDKGTLVPLGVVSSFILGAAGLGVWMDGKFDSIESSVVKIERRLERIEDRYSDRWSATDMRLWESTLSRENPTIKTPGVGVVIRERPEEKR